MVIYWFFWFFLSSMSFVKKNIYTKIFFLIFSFVLFFFIGFRYEVGGDWWNYLNIYENYKYLKINDVLMGGDVGYNILNLLSQYLNLEDTILVNAICGFLVVFFIFKLALKFQNYWLVYLVYFPYHFLVVSMGYTRQSVAIAVVTFALYCLLERKFYYFTVLTLFAFLFHRSAILVLLFFPIVLFFNYKNKVYYYFYLIVSFLTIVFLLKISLESESNMYLSSTDEINSKGFLVRWSYHLIPIFIYLKFKHLFVNNIAKYLLDYMFLLILFLFPLGVVFSTLADRFNLYLIFFDIYVICYALMKLNKKYSQIILVILIIFYTLQIYIWMFYGEWAARAWVPYQNYISNYLIESVF